CKFPDFRCKANRVDGENMVSKTHCLWVLCLAYMKREQAEKTKGGKPKGAGSKITLPQIVKMLNSPTPLPNGKTRKLALEEALGDAIVIEGFWAGMFRYGYSGTLGGNHQYQQSDDELKS
ncbi:MAG: hypothetical protein ACKPEQ_12190, partial [Dolichospermum sp.]